MNAATTTRPATDRQIGFIRSLMADRNLTGTKFAAVDPTVLDRVLAVLTSRQASEAIDLLLACPARTDRLHAEVTAPSAPRPVVAEGYYALPIPGVEDGWNFYRVVAGRREGVRFVNRFRSDALDRLTWTQQIEILEALAPVAETAAQAFADHAEACRRCGRKLTDIPTAKTNGGWGPECVKIAAR